MPSVQPAAVDDRRRNLREAGRRKLEEFKRRQLMEMHPTRNMLAMTQYPATKPSEEEDPDSYMAGVPMRQQRAWSAHLMPYRMSLRPPAEQPLHNRHSPAAAVRPTAPVYTFGTHGTSAGSQNSTAADGLNRIGVVKRALDPRQTTAAAAGAGAGAAAAATAATTATAGTATAAGTARGGGQHPRPVQIHADGRKSPVGEASAASSPGRDSDLVSMLLQQVSSLQADKQRMQQAMAALEQENGNLQELVGFLTDEASAVKEHEGGEPRGTLHRQHDSGSDYDLSVGDGDLDGDYNIMPEE